MLLSQFRTTPMFCPQLYVAMDLYTGFSGGSKVVWYFHFCENFPQYAVSHIVKGFSIVNEAEVDVFLEFSCFFDVPTYAGNLISGFSAFSKSSLYIWKFSVHILLKPSSKDFEHYLVACELSTPVQQFQHSLALPFFAAGMKTEVFQSCGHCWVYQICWHIEYNTLTA